MSLYLNYKLVLNSGETFESTNGGYQGPVRDTFLAETPIAKLQTFIYDTEKTVTDIDQVIPTIKALYKKINRLRFDL